MNAKQSKRKYLSIAIVSSLLCLSGCNLSYNDKDKDPTLKDNAEWYSQGTGNSVVEARVHIPTPNDYLCKPYNNLNTPERPCTLKDIEEDRNPNDSYEPQLHVFFSSDEFLDGGYASMEQKGKSTRQAEQTSFRIEFDPQTPSYNDERTYQLNKHFYDASRVKNMLAFTLFQDTPNFTSLRTKFFHLTIDGVNYGLFTHVEKCDKLWLTHHNFSDKDNLYKAQNFSFYLTPELQLNSNGDPLNPAAFDSSLEIKNGKDTKKVIDMIEAINNAQNDSDFEKAFDKYFDRNNYITWLAINVLMANLDTVTQNFFLLNPKGSYKFYFLPWDYDNLGYFASFIPKPDRGLPHWWKVPLHNKFLRIKKNRDDLNAMIYHLRATYFSDEKIHALMDKYRPLVEPYVTSSPDARYLYGRWYNEFNNVRNTMLANNLNVYEAQKGHPMPFWQTTNIIDSHFALNWGKSVDLEGDPIMYTLEVSSTPDFKTTIIHETQLTETDPRIVTTQDSQSLNYVVPDGLLKKNKTYYMKVTSYEVNNPAHYQNAFDNELENYPGVLAFHVQ